MAKIVSVLTPQEMKLIERAHAVLGEFLAAQKPAASAKAPAAPAKRSHHKKKGAAGAKLTKSGQPRKPTGAAAHKANAKPAAPANGGGSKAYPPVQFDPEQQAQLDALEQNATETVQS